MNYDRAITYGTFDLLHIGHLILLRRIKNLANHLYVALSSDDFSREQKHKQPVQPWILRKHILESIGLVDMVLLEDAWEQKQFNIDTHHIDVLVMGDDWRGKFDFVSCPAIYLPRTEGISTEHLKGIINGDVDV